MMGAKAGVASNIEDGKVVLGTPAIDANKTKRYWVVLPQLPSMRKKLRKLEEQIAELKNKDKT